MKTFLHILFLCIALNVSAQSITPTVVAATGNYFSAANGSLSFTVGEIVTTTISSSNNIITQGFQQPSSTATAVTEIENPVFDMNVFPNPTDGIIYINTQNLLSEDAQLYVVDVLGRKLQALNVTGTEMTLDLQKLSAGNYFIVIQTHARKIFTHKITKVQ